MITGLQATLKNCGMILRIPIFWVQVLFTLWVKLWVKIGTTKQCIVPYILIYQSKVSKGTAMNDIRQLTFSTLFSFILFLVFSFWSLLATKVVIICNIKVKPAYKSCDPLQIRVLSLVENLFVKKNPLQDVFSSLNAVISTNERS